jgi:hypothetical protein
MIGRFKDASAAREVKEIIDEITNQVAKDQASGALVIGSPSERYGQDMLELLMRRNIGSIGAQELEQFAYEIKVDVDKSDVVVTTDEIDISALLKVLFLKGARIEIYSAHDHPDTGHGRGH